MEISLKWSLGRCFTCSSTKLYLPIKAKHPLSRIRIQMSEHQILNQLCWYSIHTMPLPSQRRNVRSCSRLRLTLVRFSMTCRILQMPRVAAQKLPAGLNLRRRLRGDDGLKQLLICGEVYPAVLVGGVPTLCQNCGHLTHFLTRIDKVQ